MYIKLRFDTDWKFRKSKNDPLQQVNLPHTPQMDPPEEAAPYQGESVYEKEFDCPQNWLQHRVAFLFEGVMQKCRVLINGNEAAVHYGGYLPFTVEAGPYLRSGKNIITVYADNRDDSSIPPGKSTSGLDFVYYGGIYRQVYLLVTPKLYLNDAVECGTVGAGGLYIQTKSLEKTRAGVLVKATFTNRTDKAQNFTVTFQIKDGAELAGEWSQTLRAGKSCVIAQHHFTLQNPHVWELDDPHLYTLTCTWEWGGSSYTAQESFGVRTATVGTEGFMLNGKVIYLYGVNRHQQFPYIGQAASDRAQRREARLLKSMGINTVRLSHYPQSPAFLDECDRIGLLLIEPVPGWQFFRKGIFKKRLLQNAQDMVRRDRNHPSVVIFEASPNETPRYFPGASDRFFRRIKEAIQAEMPGCLTSGDTVGRRNAAKIGYDIPHTGEGKKSSPGGKRTLTREYGDWAFGGNYSSSRVTRGGGERAQQIQAWNFQWDHNNNRLTKHLLGDLVWEGIDHVRGYFPEEPVSTSGVLDIFRLPKYSFYFYQSQQHKEPVIFPAIDSLHTKSNIPVYANCDLVEVWAGQELLAAQACDSGPSVPFDEKKFKKTNDNYWMTDDNQVTASSGVSDLGRHTMACLFDGGNCEAVKQPPFTFKNLNLDGITSVTFIGKRDGKEVVRETFTEPGEPAGLTIDAAEFGLPLSREEQDFIFLYVSVRDAAGNLVRTASNQITLTAENGEIIGPCCRAAEAGIAPFLLRAKDAEQINLAANAAGLTVGEYRLQCD